MDLDEKIKQSGVANASVFGGVGEVSWSVKILGSFWLKKKKFPQTKLNGKPVGFFN